jgi:serine/threonine protein phosphatase 1
MDDIPHFTSNTAGTDYIVGDLHGCYDTLMDSLSGLSFDPAYDRLFSVGDLIDRGPDSLCCLRLIREPWFFPVLGNHEQMMLETLAGGDETMWVMNGGQWYARLTADERRETDSLKPVLAKLPRRITLEDRAGNRIGVSHAQPHGPEFCAPLDHRSAYELVWGRSVIQSRRPYDMTDVHLTVHGHTPVDRVTPIGRHLFIDTGAVFGGELSVLTVAGLSDLIETV